MGRTRKVNQTYSTPTVNAARMTDRATFISEANTAGTRKKVGCFLLDVSTTEDKGKAKNIVFKV